GQSRAIQINLDYLLEIADKKKKASKIKASGIANGIVKAGEIVNEIVARLKKLL
ncbi:37485_t:CDS:1, partial [Gigaspora margarita]